MAKRSIKSSENVNITRYTPTEWASGDVITAKKLNNMEVGIEAATSLVVTFSGTTNNASAACDKTFNAIEAAVSAGRPIRAYYSKPERENYYLYGLNINYFYAQDGNALQNMEGVYYNIDGDGYGERIYCNIANTGVIDCKFEPIAGGGSDEAN